MSSSNTDDKPSTSTPVSGETPTPNTTNNQAQSTVITKDAKGSFGSGSTPTEVTVESSVEKAKRAFALKKYEQAVEHYATALELMTKKVGEYAPEAADLYFAYGKALLENAISQSGVLGKAEPEEVPEEDSKPSVGKSGGPVLSFSGDGEEEDEVVDLLEHANKVMAEGDEDEEEEEEGEPEDDFNAAWEVLDLARAIYEKQTSQDKDDVDELKLKLADTYIALGDVSLETEKFDQAIADFEAGLKLKEQLLPISSRQIAEAHYKLSIVLDLTSGRLSESIVHAEKALESVEHRLAELRDGLNGQLPPFTEDTPPSDAKGKGKATHSRLVKDMVQKMTRSQMEAELKELAELREDLALKVDELKTTPSENSQATAPALAAQALDQELNVKPAGAETPTVVNDLTSMVKKKKKNPDESKTGKRKAEGEVEHSSPTEKKLKLDSESTPLS
ncbi:hypothetical protein AX16_001445 [Volvariella volvacea WC 439]|nr:hypothetical protein AX16_001445 [Volvariella volvacea WC 439]